MNVGIDWSTYLTKTKCPSKFKGLRVQLPNRFLILSSNSNQESFSEVELIRGVPKNLEGREPCEKPKMRVILH